MYWRCCNVTQSNGHLVYSYVGGPVLVQFALTTAQLTTRKSTMRRKIACATATVSENFNVDSA